MILLLFLSLQQPFQDTITHYLQSTSIQPSHKDNVSDFIRMGLKLALSSQYAFSISISILILSRQNPIAVSLFTFFKTSFLTQPMQAWWDSNLSKFHIDLQNLIQQVKSTTLPAGTVIPAFSSSSPQTSVKREDGSNSDIPESKRVHVEPLNETNTDNMTAEGHTILANLEKFTTEEMLLYLQNMRTRPECM